MTPFSSPPDGMQAAQALAVRGRYDEAIAVLRAVTTAEPASIVVRRELADLLRRAGRLEEAVTECRALLALAPDHAPLRLTLGAALIDSGRTAEAESPLREALTYAGPPSLKAAIYTMLGLALRRQRKDVDAAQNYDMALALDPEQPELGLHRGEALQNLQHYDEALLTYRQALAHDPANPNLHKFYNDLLYRLGRMDDYLKSYDQATPTPGLLAGKAYFLAQEKRFAEAYVTYSKILTLDAGNGAAILGAGDCLLGLKRYGDAAAVFDALLQKGRDVPALLGRAAEAALLQGDAPKAAVLCMRGLAASPHDQACLARLSVAWRLLDDDRDESLCGYDMFIRSFDLEPPEGFSGMADFNAELCAYLDRLHPDTREYVNQSLRGGTQTPDHIFGAGHDLVDRLERRISQAVESYIDELRRDDVHPFLSRRSRDFRYAGSWSSRLRDQGFHLNHIHPQGWISSCYYVGVPSSVEDADAKQGWIKFGEPGMDVTLANPVRKMIQPRPGRLVLFPSYVWHGTVPFHDNSARTTIAFDVVPRA
jgi:tetratricopeptide (TPR) repeat protein